MKSMTAFARTRFEINGAEYSMEIRSVNNRFRDIAMRLPSGLNVLEEKIRQKIAECVNRGRINLAIVPEFLISSAVEVSVNKELARQYFKAMLAMKEELELGGEIEISTLCRQPDLFQVSRPEYAEENLWAEFVPYLDDILLSFNGMRAKEADNLEVDISGRLDEIDKLLIKIESKIGKVVEEYADRIKERSRQLTEGMEIDEQRLIMEIAIMAERSDITEELVRTRSHLKQFRNLMNSENPVGRKMDFLVQELNREINTIGSKSNNAEISHSVVEAKGELEKIREQVQNIE